MTRRVWKRRDVWILALLFYFLGILTSLLFYLFMLLQSPPSPLVQAMDEDASRLYRPNLSNSSEPLFPSLEDQEIWETTTVIRSALYQFVVQKGYMPDQLSELTEPFPHNYLTALPKEPMTLSNEVVPTFTGSGGWVYKPPTHLAAKKEKLEALVADSILPNVNWEEPIPFAPLEIYILKSEHTLQLIAGNIVIREYEVGLGANDRTPEKSFSVQKKVMNPNGQGQGRGESPYGSRGMELSNYAIHGTNDRDSIGKNESQGCIRMYNGEIAELYAMTPLYTPVHIVKEEQKIDKQERAAFSNNGRQVEQTPLYKQDDRWEEYSDYTYKWAG